MSTGFKFGAVILAAGFSTRMRRPKMLLPWGSTTILGRLIYQWTAAGATQLAVVCRPEDVEIHAELDRLQLPAENRIPNPDAKRGMFSSIECAAGWAGWGNDLAAIALVLGDQPHLEQPTLERLRDFASKHPQFICQPEFDGRPRHPVFLPRSIFLKQATTHAVTLKDFLSKQSAAQRTVGLDDPGLALDLDIPEDYQRALANFQREGKPPRQE